MPRPLRGIFRKRRHLLHHLFRTAIECLSDWFQARLGVPDGQLAAVAAIQTFGDYLVFHPHLHVLAATGLYDREGRFHEIPVETLEPLAELFRHRFIATLLDKKIISERKARQLLNWKHSGFSIDAGERPVRSVAGRQQLAEYLLRAPFSLEKITWVEKTKRVIYRSSRSWRTKRNFEVFTATEFLAAAVEHIPPKNQHTVRYYGRYSNKCRGMEVQAWEDDPADLEPSAVPPTSPQSARNLRPLWRNLILRIWGEDPLLCPCCKGLMKVAGSLTRPEEIEFFLRLHGMWEGIIDIPPPSLTDRFRLCHCGTCEVQPLGSTIPNHSLPGVFGLRSPGHSKSTTAHDSITIRNPPPKCAGPCSPRGDRSENRHLSARLLDWLSLQNFRSAIRMHSPSAMRCRSSEEHVQRPAQSVFKGLSSQTPIPAVSNWRLLDTWALRLSLMRCGSTSFACGHAQEEGRRD